jgi:fibronectin type 3 domain-containing protein
MTKYKILFEPAENGYNVYTGSEVEEYQPLCFIDKENLYEDVLHYESMGAQVFFGNKSK